jgi:hypothetical protein
LPWCGRAYAGAGHEPTRTGEFITVMVGRSTRGADVTGVTESRWGSGEHEPLRKTLDLICAIVLTRGTTPAVAPRSPQGPTDPVPTTPRTPPISSPTHKKRNRIGPGGVRCGSHKNPQAVERWSRAADQDGGPANHSDTCTKTCMSYVSCCQTSLRCCGIPANSARTSASR